MADSPKPRLTGADVAKRIERLLTPIFAECFTKETKKLRDFLLVTSFSLTLVIVGALEVDPKTKIPALGFSITFIMGVRWLLAALSTYFLFSLGARSYIEWNLWRLKHQAPMLHLSNLQSDISASIAAHYSRINSAFKYRWELYEKLKLLGEDTPAISQIVAERDELNRQYRQLSDKFDVQWQVFKATEPTREERRAMENDVMLPLHNMFNKLNQLNAKLDKERAARKEHVAENLVTLKRQISETDEEQQKLFDDPDFKFLQATLNYLLDVLKPAVKTLRIRFVFEMAFPMLFGVTAIVSSFIIRPNFPVHTPTTSSSQVTRLSPTRQAPTRTIPPAP